MVAVRYSKKRSGRPPLSEKAALRSRLLLESGNTDERERRQRAAGRGLSGSSDGGAPGRARATRLISTAFGAYAIAAGAVSFVGWAADAPVLTNWGINDISIQPNTTLAAMLAGAGLLLLSRGSRRMAMGAALGAGVLGSATLFEYLSGVALGIDTLLLFDRPWGRLGTLVPGRMGPPAATSFTFIGIGLSLAAAGPRTRRFAPIPGIVVACIAMLSVTGYLFGASLLYTLPRLTAIALQTSTILLALGLGLVLAVPEHEPTRTLRDAGAAGVLARRALPFILVVPIALSIVRTKGEATGLFDSGMGSALQALVLILLLVGLVWWNAAAIRVQERAQRETAERLREADRRKDEFLATLAHELRGPLAPLRNSLEILKQAGHDGASAELARSTMERQMAQMVHLVDDLLDVGRITHNKLTLRRSVVELASIVQHVVEAARPMVESRRLELKVTLSPEPVYLDADAARLTQVFGNLLSNACKYTDPGGRIELRAERDGSDVVVSVIDDGAGIPPEMLPRVFDLFAQVDQRREGTEGGLGIGLALVRQLVELHDGSATGHSEGLGRGSRFTVRLPALAEKPSLPALSPPPETRSPGQRILVVDDNRDSAESMALLLELSGHQTEMAHDGAEAVAKAASYDPDVILLDLGLPGMSGYEACRTIRAQSSSSRGIFILALTGWGQEADRRRSHEAGFDGHLVKPVDPAALMKLLNARRAQATT